MKQFIVIINIFLMLMAVNSNGQVYYVSPGGSPSNPGTEEAPWSLGKANASLLPGETAILLNGTYRGTPIAPSRSGEEGAYVTFRAQNRHMAVFQDISELPDSRGPVAFFLNDKSYIAIVGMKVTGVKRWVMGVKSHHITMDQCYLTEGSGWNNCRFEENGDGMRITDNYFHGGTDLLTLDGGNGHLVEGNFFGDASHTGLVFLGVQNSVVRNNTMTNRLWRCMEVESQRHEPFRLSMYNLIENNYFDFSPAKSIQYAGNYSIIRRNIFRRGLTGMSWSNYLGGAKTPEAWHDEHNRFYNNVITECGSNDIVAGIIEDNASKGINVAESVRTEGFGMVYLTNLFNPPMAEYPDVAYGDNIVVNNIFYMNSNTMLDKASESSQIAFNWNATPDYATIQHNNIYNGSTGSDAFYFLDAPLWDPPQERNSSILSFELTYPQCAFGNSEVNPKFENSPEGNYKLTSGSECIDLGIALTKAVSAGQGTVIPVLDAIWFTDGYGLVNPDKILIHSQQLTIVDVDYDLNKITVDQEVTWDVDEEVFFEFQGEAPDLGAYEVGEVYEIGADPSMFEEGEPIVGIHQTVPPGIRWMGNFPNPFHRATSIRFEMEESSEMTIEIYNTSGSKIVTLASDFYSSGRHTVDWNGKGQNGVRVSPGLYFCRLSPFEKTGTQAKMLLLD